jgi:hypothetical protein
MDQNSPAFSEAFDHSYNIYQVIGKTIELFLFKNKRTLKIKNRMFAYKER